MRGTIVNNKNLLIGFGETLTAEVDPPRGGGGKKHPYTFEQAQARLAPQMKKLSSRLKSVPLRAAPKNKLVAKFTLHPAYYGKSYFPENIFHNAGLINIGSKGIHIKPEVSTNSRLKGEQATTTLYMEGTQENFNAFSSILDGNANKTLKKEISQFETIDYFESQEKVKYLTPDSTRHKLEVVLQSGNDSEYILDYFNNYATSLGCQVDLERRLQSGGLIFLPVHADNNCIHQLAEYTHLRVLREMADLRIHKPNVFRQSSEQKLNIPLEEAINKDVKVAVFDGGAWCK